MYGGVLKAVTLILAVLLAALFVLFFRPAVAPNAGIGHFLLLAMASVAVYFVLLRSARRLSLFGMHRSTLFVLVALAVTIRAVVLFGSDTSTLLSGDVYRYIFEGNMVMHGFNPYTTAPDSIKEPPMIDTTIFPHIRQPDQPTVFPPLSQYLFGVAWYIHNDSIHGFKLLSVLFELMTMLSIVVLIASRVKRRPHTSWSFLIYLFSPLVIIEFVMSSHVDILAMPFFVFSLVYLRRNKAARVGLMLGLAAMVKLFALFFAPVILFYFVGKDRWRFLLAMVATCLVLYLPFLLQCGTSVFGPLTACFTQWQFGGSFFPLLEMVAGGVVARVIAGLLFAAVILWAAIPGRKVLPDVFLRLFVVFGAFVILTPALFPWYLVWLVPFVVYYRNIPFLVLSGTVLLSYYGLSGFYHTGVWLEPWWIALLQYVPFYALLAWAGRKQWKKRQRLAAAVQ